MILTGRRVVVKDGNVDRALKKFKKKVADSGFLMKLKEKEEYIKPSVERKVRKALAKKRWKKYVESQKLPTKHF